jgi:tripartite-type tricarboxylate transporter receptor subunit TctC
MRRGITACAAVLSLGALMTGTATAQEFYSGKTVKIIVASTSGGGYDQYARMLAKHMPKYIPGNPLMIVVNMPGAGGLTAANHLYNVAEKDGTVIGTLNRYSAVMPVLGVEQARFKTEEFQWLGTTASYSDNSYFMFVRADLPHKTIADLRDPKKEVVMGVTGTDVPAILKEALGLNFKIVTGYKSHDELMLAMQRGEIDGNTDGYISLKATRPDWFTEPKFIRPMIQFGRVDRLPELGDVPTARELAQTADDRKLIEFAEAPLLMARPFAAPPGVPKDRVEILRNAFWKTMSDPGYLEDVRIQKAEHSPSDGKTVQEVAVALTKAPPAVVNRYLKALGGKPPSGG